MNKICSVICYLLNLLFVGSIENLKTIEYHLFLKKQLVISVICSKCDNEDEKNIWKGESIEISKNSDLIKNI